MDLSRYTTETSFDELIHRHKPRMSAKQLFKHLQNMDNKELRKRQQTSERAIQSMGITFTLYNQKEVSIDRNWPFDIIPRIIPLSEWQYIEKGLAQRVTALNMFIHDIYHQKNIIRDGIFPAEVLTHSTNYLPQCEHHTPAHNIWAHICGSDLIRDQDGRIYVLEDNLRIPSGVSYMLENRLINKRILPELFTNLNIMPVDQYPSQLFDTLAALSPRNDIFPEIVLLTPGIYNSAYFEHAYLAQQMGCKLVEGKDLIVGNDDCVYMRTVNGLSRVDVIYRRINELFIDPETFNTKSTLGIKGLIRAWRKGNVALANAPGTGIADDKVVYAFVPDMIKYYLGEDAILPNVETYLCMFPKQREYVLKNLHKLVIKPANESGGYGILIGPTTSRKQLNSCAECIKKNPRNYIAQPVINISTAPTLIRQKALEPRHVDLRPFILSSNNIKVTTGGLTRVAMQKNSLIVNSSQGGGSKDTWVVDTQY